MTTESGAETLDQLRNPVRVIVAVSTAAIFFLLYILFLRDKPDASPDTLSFMPALNATLNGLAAVCLVCGYTAIRMRKIRIHMTFMITTMLLSASFLVSYIIYHTLHGDTPFPGEGTARTIYLTVLFSHIACTVVTLPMIITTFFLAFTRRFALHKKVARITLPLWLYVSVTGVTIYLLLRAATAAAG